MQTPTAYSIRPVKTPTTWDEIQKGDLFDGYLITEVQHRGNQTRAYFFQGGGWSAWQDNNRPVSVYR